MSEDETRKQLEEDASEDLELTDEDADDVAGGSLKIKLDSTDLKLEDKW
jgi:hypothetical protein